MNAVARGSGNGFAAGHKTNNSSNSSSHGFFPAVTHFTDCITALPKEVVRHFTLLKEVDAKAYGPEDALKELTDLAIRPFSVKRKDCHSESMLDAANQAPENSLKHPRDGNPNDGPVQTNLVNSTQDAGAPEDSQANLARRQLFLNLRYVLNEMLMTLDEKNHVISTANEALQKQLARADACFPYIDNEISEEARLGSLSHWAYIEKTNGRTNGTTNERPRRDLTTANSVAATLAAMNDEGTATRSESRRETLLARKQRNQTTGDSTMPDVAPGRHRDVSTNQSVAGGAGAKKGGASARPRKTGETQGATGQPVTPVVAASGIGPPNKRRRVEKSVASRTPAAREPSILDAADTTGAGGRADAASPRATPAADSGRKRVRNNATAAGTARKR